MLAAFAYLIVTLPHIWDRGVLCIVEIVKSDGLGSLCNNNCPLHPHAQGSNAQ